MKIFSAKSVRIISIAVAFCAARLFASTGGALILERAGSNENIYSSATGEFISYLRGDVVFLYEDLRISAEDAVWQKNDGIVNFTKDVKVEQKGQLMTCDRLIFVRDKNILTASGNVLYQDSARITFISGSNAEYATDKKECVLTGRPVLTRVDSTEADTLFIRGRVMAYNDSTKIAAVTDNVNVSKGSLTATGRRGEYFLNENMAKLRENPVINYEKHRVVGDSLDLFFGKESLKSAYVVGNAHGYYMEVADSTNNVTITNIWSDSLHLSMFESGKIDFMKAVGGARGNYFEVAAASNDTTATHISSDSMHMFMRESGKISAMKAFGGARGSYSEASSASGSATAISITSDSLHMFMFESGKVSAMKAFGSAHGRSAEWSSPSQAASSLNSEARDSTITHIWSDSLRVSMSDAGKISSMRAFGNVLSKNFALGDSARANEVSGSAMALAFGPGGKVEKAVVKGNAKSVYFIEESEGGGRNEAGGDRIIVTFSSGKAQRIRVRGNVKGFYAP